MIKKSINNKWSILPKIVTQQDLPKEGLVKLVRHISEYIKDINLEQYIDPKFKFDLLNKYFGISAIILNPTNHNKKLQKKQIKELRDAKSLIAGDYFALLEAIKVLSK